MPFAQLNGQKIHYRDSGGRGPAVVLSHGFLMDSTMFDSQVAALSDKFRVITWDERGFGETEYDGKPFTYWDSANDCLALMTHLGVDTAILGGMSQGGFLSLRAMPMKRALATFFGFQAVPAKSIDGALWRAKWGSNRAHPGIRPSLFGR